MDILLKMMKASPCSEMERFGHLGPSQPELHVGRLHLSSGRCCAFLWRSHVNLETWKVSLVKGAEKKVKKLLPWTGPEATVCTFGSGPWHLLVVLD